MHRRCSVPGRIWGYGLRFDQCEVCAVGFGHVGHQSNSRLNRREDQMKWSASDRKDILALVQYVKAVFSRSELDVEPKDELRNYSPKLVLRQILANASPTIHAEREESFLIQHELRPRRPSLRNEFIWFHEGAGRVLDGLHRRQDLDLARYVMLPSSEPFCWRLAMKTAWGRRMHS